MAAEPQPDVDPLLGDPEAILLQPGQLGGKHRTGPHVDQRRSAPQPQCLVEGPGRGDVVAPGGGRTRLDDLALVPRDVHRLVRHVQQVSARPRHEDLLGGAPRAWTEGVLQQAAQFQDVGVQGGQGAARNLLTVPDLVHERCRREHLVGVEGHQGEQLARLVRGGDD